MLSNFLEILEMTTTEFKVGAGTHTATITELKTSARTHTDIRTITELKTGARTHTATRTITELKIGALITRTVSFELHHFLKTAEWLLTVSLNLSIMYVACLLQIRK
jgi:hypothetical protein